MASFTQWQSQGQYPAGDAPFRAAEVHGPQPFFRGHLDELRTMWRRTPNAEYPDGYVGTVESRRRDRLGMGPAQQNKPYSRGVHKGEKLDAQDYFWPDEFNLATGLDYEMAGIKFVQPGVLIEAGMAPNTPNLARVAGNRNNVPRANVNEAEMQDQYNRAMTLRRLGPSWSSGGPGQAIPYPGR